MPYSVPINSTNKVIAMIGTKRELTDGMPYCFPFVAFLRGQQIDYKRVDEMVTVLGYAGLEKHYLRVKRVGGAVTIASDSMLYVIE